MRRFVILLMIGVFIYLGAGCATKSPDADKYLARLDTTIHETNVVTSSSSDSESALTPDNPDSPDTPMTDLPPPPNGDSGDDYSDIGDESITIQPDCLLMINVAEDPSLDGTYTVNNLGAVQLKYVGPVFLFNKTEREAARKIEEVLKMRSFSKATVKVRIIRASYDKVKVIGKVAKPGIIQIGAGETISLNDLLLRAGGLNIPASRVKISVVKDGLQSPLAYSLPGKDYYLVDSNGIPRVPEIRLRNNDLVRVVEKTGMVAGSKQEGVTGSDSMEPKTLLVLGEVRRRGFVTFGPEEPCTMMRLIFKLGGLPPYAKTKAIRVIRKNDKGEEQEFIVDARKILKDGNPDDDFPLQDGDRIIVPARRISLF